MLLFGSYQEIDNISWWMQSDTCALGILTASAAAYRLSPLGSEGRKWLYAIPLLAVSMGFYQTFGTYFLVLFLTMLLLLFIQEGTSAAKRFALRGAGVMLLALFLYFAINKCMGLLIPERLALEAAKYEGGLSGWEKFLNSGSTEQFWLLVNYGVAQPLRRFFTLRGGHWLYLSTLLPVLWLAIRFAWRKRYMNALAIAAVGAAVIYIPFLFAPLLLGQIGFTERMMNAVPVSTACLWGMAFILEEGHFRRHAQMYGTILALVAVQALYLSGAASRDRLFRHERILDELRDMYMLARVEAVRSGKEGSDIVFCGIVPESPPPSHGMLYNCGLENWREDAALEDIFQRWMGTNNTFVKRYGKFLRIGKRMRPAKEEDLRQHSSKLHQMPIWPADGSVAADGDVILIKLGDEMEPGVPLPLPKE